MPYLGKVNNKLNKYIYILKKNGVNPGGVGVQILTPKAVLK